MICIRIQGPACFPGGPTMCRRWTRRLRPGMAGLWGSRRTRGYGGSGRAAECVQSGCRVYGGLVLNHYIGGINPAAAEASLKLGGRILWPLTLSSRRHVEFYARQGKRFLGGSFRHDAGDGGRC